MRRLKFIRFSILYNNILKKNLMNNQVGYYEMQVGWNLFL